MRFIRRHGFTIWPRGTQRSPGGVTRSRATLHGVVFATFCPGPAGCQTGANKVADYMRDRSPSYQSRQRAPLIKLVIIFLSLVFFPIGVSAARYWSDDPRGSWQTADRSSAGLLPEASRHPDAVIRIYGARTLRWKAIFAIHTWIVI